MFLIWGLIHFLQSFKCCHYFLNKKSTCTCTLDAVEIDDIPVLWIKESNERPPQGKKIIQIIGRFLDCGILKVMPNGILNKDYTVKIDNWDPHLANWLVNKDCGLTFLERKLSSTTFKATYKHMTQIA